jgi:hypothetical protein
MSEDLKPVGEQKPRAYKVSSVREAQQILERFNHFHDGFIQRLELLSHDRFEQQGRSFTDRAHVCTGMFDVALDIAHYNYGPGDQPANRLIQCRFEDVQSFLLDLRAHQLHDWPITRIDISEVGRPRAGVPEGREKAMEVRLLRPRLVDGSRWKSQEQVLFSFARATFEEALIAG